jgi:hypothetical protein
MAVSARATATWERIGPRARDVAFVVIALLAATAETLARRHGPVLGMLLVGGAAFAGAAALWWRRRTRGLVLDVTAAAPTELSRRPARPGCR